jgi:hypothetical protein
MQIAHCILITKFAIIIQNLVVGQFELDLINSNSYYYQ